MYEKIMSLLPYGKENAKSTAALSNQLGITTRELKRLINRARIEGNIILSDYEKGGYYLSNNLDEIKEFYRWMSKRQSTTSKVLCSFRKRIRNDRSQIEGQLSLSDMEWMHGF